MNPERRRRALDALLEAHGVRLYATLFRLTLSRDAAGELLQERFARLGASAGFDHAADRAAYAWRTAINLAMEWRRRRRREGPPVPQADVESRDFSPLQRMVRAEQFEQLLDALSGLSEQSREAFVLRYLEERSFECVAERMGKTVHQARGLCHAAVRQLRARFAGAESHD